MMIRLTAQLHVGVGRASAKWSSAGFPTCGIAEFRSAERLFEVTSFFSNRPDKSAKPLTTLPYEVVLGLVTQNTGVQITLEPKSGHAAVYETVDGKGLGIGLVLNPKNVLRMAQLPAAGQAKKSEHAAIFTHPEASGKVSYRAGFAWAGDGDITTPEQWLKSVEQQAAKRP